jgi:hypothetical protein
LPGIIGGPDAFVTDEAEEVAIVQQLENELGVFERYAAKVQAFRFQEGQRCCSWCAGRR